MEKAKFLGKSLLGLGKFKQDAKKLIRFARAVH
jgi:hypothetical protein